MIYTVTFNPSLDYIVAVDDFKTGRTNRTVSEQLLSGGKGINVSIVLKNLSTPSVALGFQAGFVGEELMRRLDELGITHDFIRLPKGNSRINVKLTTIEGTEINGMGPDIGPEAVLELFERLDRLQAGDVLVLAGSIPASLSASIYKDMMARLEKCGILVVVDASGPLLRNVLKQHPFLIKPNHHELGELFGVTLSDREAVIHYARKLWQKRADGTNAGANAEGARNVLVSMGGQGAVLVAENGQVYTADAPKGQVVNAVGAGDSMVAGFLAGWLESGDYEHAFKMSVAAGSASAFSDQLATREEILALLKTM